MPKMECRRRIDLPNSLPRVAEWTPTQIHALRVIVGTFHSPHAPSRGSAALTDKGHDCGREVVRMLSCLQQVAVLPAVSDWHTYLRAFGSLNEEMSHS